MERGYKYKQKVLVKEDEKETLRVEGKQVWVCSMGSEFQ